MEFSAFSHGQIQSKIWLCDELEKFIGQNKRIAILGSWYNILGFMLLVRKPKFYKSIRGYDIDSNAIDIANRLTEAWNIQPDCFLQNEIADVTKLDLNGYDVIINTSVEHMDNEDWFTSSPVNALLCIQSSDVVLKDEVWDIKRPNENFEKFLDRFRLSNYLYRGQKFFDYGSNSYSRFMIIGYK